MKSFVFFCTILFISWSCLAGADEVTPEELVALMADNEYVLLEVYADWCSYCKKFAPDYDAFADNAEIPVVKLNGPNHREFMQTAQVTGFPTIMLYKDSEFFLKYEGQRSALDLAKWIDAVTSDLVLTLVEPGEIATFPNSAILSSNKAALDALSLYFLKNGPMVVSLVHIESNLNFVDLELAQGDLSKADFIYYDAKGQSLVELPVDGTSPVAVSQWLFQKSKPSVARIDVEGAFLSHAKASQMSMLLFVKGDYTGEPSLPSNEDDLLSESERSALETFVKETGVQVLYIPTGRYGQYFASVMGPDTPLPSFAVVEWENSSPVRSWYQPKYFDASFNIFSTIETDITPLTTFLNGIKDKSLKWLPKSEPIPLEQESVFTVVADNYEQVVLDSTKDVLLELYSPTCPHCVKLAPAYKEVSETFEDNENIIIAKMNGQGNDLPPEVMEGFQGFPTILFFPSNSKDSPILYSSPERTHDSIVDFVINHATVELGDIADDTLSEEHDL